MINILVIMTSLSPRQYHAHLQQRTADHLDAVRVLLGHILNESVSRNIQNSDFSTPRVASRASKDWHKPCHEWANRHSHCLRIGSEKSCLVTVDQSGVKRGLHRVPHSDDSAHKVLVPAWSLGHCSHEEMKRKVSLFQKPWHQWGSSGSKLNLLLLHKFSGPSFSYTVIEACRTSRHFDLKRRDACFDWKFFDIHWCAKNTLFSIHSVI